MRVRVRVMDLPSKPEHQSHRRGRRGTDPARSTTRDGSDEETDGSGEETDGSDEVDDGSGEDEARSRVRVRDCASAGQRWLQRPPESEKKRGSRR